MVNFLLLMLIPLGIALGSIYAFKSKVTLAEFAAILAVPAYAGQFGWDKDSLAWGTRLLSKLDPFYRVSVHRYPPTGARVFEDFGANGFLAFKDVVGSRRWAVLECGWNQGPWKTFWDHFIGSHHHLSDQQQAAAIGRELSFYEGAGADFAILYQLNDGPDRCPQHQWFCGNWRESFGVRRFDGSWKPSAEIGGGS